MCLFFLLFLITVSQLTSYFSVVLDADGKPTEEERVDGRPDPRFLKEHGLTRDSHPVEFVDAFLPVYDKKRGVNRRTKYTTSVEVLCKWSNAKAILMGMGTDACYPKFKPFDVKEFEKHLYFYYFNGLNPSPRVQMKFKTNDDDPVQGNNFINRVFGSGAGRRHREWKCCFATQDPLVTPPSRKTHPNWKIDPFLKHVQEVSRAGWLLARYFSLDEQTAGFKGRHVDKKRITYKKEGDGFQMDAICDRGFTYAYYMRNQLAPKKYLDQGLSPLHARCMSLFDTLKDSYHEANFDNLYTSTKFAFFSYVHHPKKVKTQGVIRSGGKGCPAEVVQREEADKKNAEKVR